jgi:hypothetical protein
MPLDNEIIKKMLEIIKNDHVLMLEIIKDNSLNNEEKSIPEPVVEKSIPEPVVEKSIPQEGFEKDKENILEKDKEFVPIKRKYIKKSISATMRRKVWDEYIGKKIGEAKCLCCKMTDITQLTFHCGHIIPECKGGEITLSNIRPICSNCNSSMGTINMNDFMKTLE